MLCVCVSEIGLETSFYVYLITNRSELELHEQGYNEN